MSVVFGIDQALGTPDLLAGRVGLVTNSAACTAKDAGLPSRIALQRAGVRLVRLFSPEHGVQVQEPDGSPVKDSFDVLTGLPVVSLYGDRMRPTGSQLADLDAVVFDIPDIGARFYTYIWTLSCVLEACAEAGKRVIILDRPNPIGGDVAFAEGPILDVANCSSFLGRAAIPIRHSLTVGELAMLWNKEGKLNAEVQVSRCSGWSRSMHWPETGLPFVRTSPAISSYESALLYPGICLFEATNLSVGRGTDLPFQIIGATWLEGREVADRLNAAKLDGVVAEPCHFIPHQNPFKEETCAGVRLRLTHPKKTRPVTMGLRLLADVVSLHREHFHWASYPTAANPSGGGHFERLVGQRGIDSMIEQDPDAIGPLVASWTAAPGWRERWESARLYD